MGVTIRKYFQSKTFKHKGMQEASTVRAYPGLENGWTGYEQLAGSPFTSTKRAEIEVLSCLRVYHVYKDR